MQKQPPRLTDEQIDWINDKTIDKFIVIPRFIAESAANLYGIQSLKDGPYYVDRPLMTSAMGVGSRSRPFHESWKLVPAGIHQPAGFFSPATGRFIPVQEQTEPEIAQGYQFPKTPRVLDVRGLKTFTHHRSMPFGDTNSAVLTFRHRPCKGDSVTVGGLEHTFRRTKLKRVGSELRKALGTRYGVEEHYATKGRRKVLTLIISKAL